MTQRERTLEELLSALTSLLDQMRACRCCHMVPNEDGSCRRMHEWPYKKLRARIATELGRRAN